MATKRKGSSKYRYVRKGLKHSAEDCPICAGRICRVIVSNPVEGECEAMLIPLDNGRTALEGVKSLSPTFRIDRPIGSGRPVRKPLPKGYVPGLRRPDTGTIHIPTATILVIQALQTWGASHARL